MNNDIMQRKNELYKKSRTLRELAHITDNYDQAIKIRKEQDDAYKRWEFLKKYNEAKNKIENKVKTR